MKELYTSLKHIETKKQNNIQVAARFPHESTWKEAPPAGLVDTWESSLAAAPPRNNKPQAAPRYPGCFWKKNMEDRDMWYDQLISVKFNSTWMPCTKNQVVPYRFSEDFSTWRYHKWGIGSPGRPFFCDAGFVQPQKGQGEARLN